MKLPLFKTPRKNILPQLAKIILGLAFAAACTLIILPQIDYKPWYPDMLGTYDATPGVAFQRHTLITMAPGETEDEAEKSSDLGPEVTVGEPEVAVDQEPTESAEEPENSSEELSEETSENTSEEPDDNDLTTNQYSRILSTLNKRIISSGVETASVSLDGKIILVRIPESYPEVFVRMLTSQGTVKFMTPKEDIDFQNDPLLAFDSDNYNETNLSTDHISSAQVTMQEEQYTYIEIKVKNEYKNEWDTYAQENAASNIGLFIDDVPHQAWIIPPDGEQIQNPTIVISEQEPSSTLILSFLNHGPLATSDLTVETSVEEPLFPTETMYQLILGSLCISALIIFLRRIVVKDSLESTIATVLILAGVVAIIKIVSIPLTISLILTLTVLSVILLISRPSILLPLIIGITLLGVPARFGFSTELIGIGHALIIFGLFGIPAVIFYQFTKIYEET